MDHSTTNIEPIEYDYCGLCGGALEGPIDVETGVCADCMVDSLTEDSSGDVIDVDVEADSPTNEHEGTAPEYYKQTARAYGHGLTAIKGRLHDLVWKCRACGASRATAEAFQGVACGGP